MFILLALPLIGFLWLSISTLKQSYLVNNEVESLSQLTKLSITYSELVHELQKERGATAGFLSSKGNKFVNELRTQRNETDSKQDIKTQFLSVNSFEQLQISQLNQQINNELAQLSQIRTQVDNLDIEAKQAIGYYTQLNAKLLSVSTLIASLSSDANITKQTIAYYNFLQGKERAGIERAVMSSTFASDKFNDGIFVKFVSLVTQQETFMSNFLAFATPENIAYYLSLIHI